jgi:SAM-dependent methyltransferase
MNDDTQDYGAPKSLSESQRQSIEYQRERYDAEASEYDTHHGDKESQRYRTEFIRNKLFSFELKNKKVLDAMCASGIETDYLISKGASVTGLDISPNNAALYSKKWQRDCLVTSIHETGLPADSFDCVYIYGGLHHVIPCLEETMREVHRILRPGGYFAFVEPNKDTWLNYLRIIWYRADERFHETEEALSYKNQLRAFLNVGFDEIRQFTGGNISYLVISQSLIIGTPVKLKRWLYPILSWIERVLHPFPLVPHLYLGALWQKKNGLDSGD